MNGESWEMDPGTGDYVMEGGSPVVTKSLKMPAYFRLAVQRTRWLHAPNVQYGSDLWTRRERQTPNEPNIIQTIGLRALDPILLDGRASAIDITFESSSRGKVSMKASLTDATGQVADLPLNPIGR